MLSYQQARDWLLERARPLSARQILPLAQIHGRVLAEPVRAALDVPPHDNSSMDGYALRCADFAAAMPVSQRIAAGAAPQPLQPGSAARIFTGAPIPPGADAVIMQEQAQLDADGKVRFAAAPRPGQNIRLRGEDIANGQEILPAGRRLTAADLGLAASIGLAALPVLQPLRVAVFLTGDELVEPGQPLAAGQIYNSNRYWLLPALRQLGCETIDLGAVRDDLDATRRLLRDAAAAADVVITCGGVSVGEEDHVKAAVEAEGELTLWTVAIKPGKPLACGRIGDADFIGLPGNPVSGFVTLQTLVRPFLQKRMGLPLAEQAIQRYPAAFAWPKPDARRSEFLRVRRMLTDEGWQLELYPQQSSGALTSCAWADGLAWLEPGQTVAPGDSLRYWALDLA
ncbi:gephyrin-like molybdotransferase Glp [Chromobacterium subtsugae]|uniref:molybdopterin molybdotransferase MoeA n=1 Tax=Chromobacterium subtsugae TaxID=251747 RepID=UPI0007F86664|nr:gephyrin-like molybdotransferase Glp [Chromobacterium subtsugae]OBU86733.1 molybdenum cofactor biosynthesis protein MoaA [Chromobacterium subtsugae]